MKTIARYLKMGLTCAVILTSQSFAQSQAVVVETTALEKSEFHDQVTLVGRTKAWIESDIVAEVSGPIKAVNSGEGIWVEAGTPLISLDDSRMKSSLKARKAEVEQAKHQADLANLHLERTKDLFAKNLVPKSSMDSANAWAGIAGQNVKKLEADREIAALDLEKSVIRAPFTGYTGRRMVDVGEWVQTGQPVFEMVDLYNVRVLVDLPERYFGRLTIGSKVTVLYGGREEKSIDGTVIGLSPNASEETHTFPVIIGVPNSEGKLGGGMLVRATLNLDDKFTTLAVSKDAIIRQGMQTMVYTVVDGKAAPVPVTTGSTNGNKIAIEGDGLVEGMPVVVRGNERIYPGSAVQIAENNTSSQGASAPANP